jgi:tRNA threonylcarbamoyladenosine biosynthesis protein TsaE
VYSETWNKVSLMLSGKALEIITHNSEQTWLLGEALGHLLQPGDVVCLQVDLGSGKTCLTQGIGRGLRVAGVISSPTFVFITEHAPLTIGPYLYHADLYRIEEPGALFSIGLEDYVYGDGVTVIEWPERAVECLPQERLWIQLTFMSYTQRRLRLKATGKRYVALMADLVPVLQQQALLCSVPED